ncbi:uncharacterized protein SPPG_07075 [Spizellomyces punctatus DAOM BR117]|uniref:B box-type domain-containing protein n=1 Tax=Spizellomyces punctatus (strain DAOM BR117) TaxID=645134 RepID=A0A0L0H9D3_SPIPD|nr:uncharacterized protein SPPG_07075 [Spizellomyces punctatus DAOM BR117]KNC97606.1 hypothetical protein SPPG_07075 [Spizellomyces punctatus DAOM BR117]|eukprot:XP_016605646.1 hypothetical protein SPPG_07075 [Spizellomyces punctatus DAOM BR117]
MSDKLGGKTQLGPSTPEFGALEYELQLALGASTARIVAAHSLSNPHLNVQFEKRCKDMLVLSSWLDASQLAGVNTEDDVIRRGFQFPPAQQGMKFSVGSLAGKGVLKDRKGEGRTLRKALLCRVGVGRAYVADEATAEASPIPNGYDSFYLREQSAPRDGKKSLDEYHHEYYIKDTAQVVPVYLVHYDFDFNKERQSREKAKCDNCEEEHATVFCNADAANLCNKCDSQLHVSKLASRHVRTPIGKGSDVFGHCRHHPEKLIEFFCSQCHIPVCVFCKMVGNHANGEAAKHQLVSVAEAYTTVLQEAQTHDPILQTRRTEINNQIAAVNSRAKAVEKMGSQIEAQIEEMYKRAMKDLKNIVQKKLIVLLGDELELARQLAEIDRLEDFLKYQQEGDATTFLFNWSKHQQCRANLHDFRFFRNEIDVQLDAKVTGNISVIIDHDRPAVTGGDGPHGGKKHGKGASTIGPAGGLAGSFGMGMPRSKLQERRVHRRISDFFAETLGSFDQISTSRVEDDADRFSQMSTAAETF